MAGRLYEVETCVYTVVDNLESVDAVFLLEVRVKPGLDVVDNGLPARPKSGENPSGWENSGPLVVVDKVTKARGVDDGQVKPDAVLLDVYT